MDAGWGEHLEVAMNRCYIVVDGRVTLASGGAVGGCTLSRAAGGAME